jgi:hypothetical protein
MKTTTATILAAGRLKAEFGAAPLADGLLTPAKAQKHADAFNAANPADAVAKRFDDCPGIWYITLDAARVWVASMSPEAREALFDGETLMGWFVEECGDDADDDGDFCSTPGCTGSDDLDDIFTDLDNCSRAGLLMVEVPAA